jgi:tetratricopeptide (TPR) repeat protein
MAIATLLAFASMGYGASLAQTPAAPRSDAVVPPSTVSGAFLAGRQAEDKGDLLSAVEFYAAALALEPDNPRILIRGLAADLQLGRIAASLDLARRLLKHQPGVAIAELALTVDDIRAGRLAEAEQRLKTLRPSGSNAVLVPMMTAWIRAGRREFDQAQEILEQNARQGGLAAIYQFHTGLIAEFGDRTDVAEASYKKARGSGEQSAVRLIVAMGQFFERLGRGAEAEALYAAFNERAGDPIFMASELARVRSGVKPPRSIAKFSDGIAEALVDVASALQRDRAADLALIHAQLANYLRPNFAAALAVIGDVHETMERRQLAISAYESVAQDPIYGWGVRLRAAALWEKQNEFDKAAGLLESMAAERPERTDALITLGDLERGRKRFEAAAEAYDKAIRRVTEVRRPHWSIFYSRGVALERMGQWAKAEPDFLKALELEPEQPLVLNYLGYSWADQGVHLDRALPMIRRAVELTQERDGYIVDSLGWVLYRLGQFDEAVRHLERAVELRPKDPVINDHLGDAYWRVGRRIEARYQWQRALGFEPEPELIPEIKNKIENGLTPTTPKGG